MAHATDTNFSAGNAQAVSNARTFASGLVQSIRTKMEQRRVYNTTLNELLSLTTRELNDLGLHKSQLNTVAREAAYGKA
ncbi:DUF1127 domain-containing protein [Octadecabacter sp. CECT 8868]|uniref:DUF1127 domain-containing protein n=1 Tax=Octadecabacter algicola TaxID=2909342 RepID=UPI001F2573A3|nr:DUF1127 domain-containing protein [Octadecabacter algicola]MCF2904367.1 DUF1127 domain-containing protein [Octadecabacter algicola]